MTPVAERARRRAAGLLVRLRLAAMSRAKDARLLARSLSLSLALSSSLSLAGSLVSSADAEGLVRCLGPLAIINPVQSGSYSSGCSWYPTIMRGPPCDGAKGVSDALVISVGAMLSRVAPSYKLL